MENVTTLGTIGVVIPTYNRLPLLKYAIESVLRQSYENLQIIVLDDCSDDGTASYLSTVADTRFSYVVNDNNLGLAKNIDKGISLLSPEVKWCTVLCDDDYYEDNSIEHLVQTVISSKAKTIVHGHIVFVDHDGKYLRDARVAPNEESAFEFIKSRAEFTKDRYLAGVLFSREHFESIGGYPAFTTGMAADDALIFALSLEDRLVYSSQSTVYIRIHEEAESQQLVDISGHLKALQEYRHYCWKKANERGTWDPLQLASLKRNLETHVREMDTRLWIQSIEKLKRSGVSDQAPSAKSLYRLGADREFLFPLRVRISSFCALLAGICPERIGLYRNLWRQIGKLIKK